MINLRNNKRNNEKGITMMALVITIVVLIILASVATYSGIQSISSAKLTLFTTELKIMQTQVNSLNQKMVNNETITINGQIYKGDGTSKDQNNQPISGIQEIGKELDEKDKKTLQSLNFKEEEIGKFKIYDGDIKEPLKIEGVSQDVLVDVTSRQVVSRYGISYNGNQWYTLSEVPDSLYNVEYDDSSLTSKSPTFDVTYKKIGTENRWEVTISNIEYDANISNWTVKYRLCNNEENLTEEEQEKKEKEENLYWNNSDSMTFVVNESGMYRIKILNGTIESDVKKIQVKNKLENPPILGDGMTGIYWDEDGNEKEITSKNDNNWYDYEDSRWANAKTKDGSYWVWIPRYEYKIHNDTQTIDVNFMKIGDTTTTDYKLHPAFEDGSDTGKKNNYMNGEWDSELSGFWVAKYEISMETSRAPTITESEATGNVSTTDTIKAVSKPGVTSWRYITIGNSYTNSYNYDRDKQSHLMKNSEWGAVAYLTQSSFGRNGTEISINDNPLFYTGGSQNATASTNVNQSTTGNSTGIYDLSGGAWERVAAYITNGNPSLTSYGKDASGNTFVAKTVADGDAYKTLSTKYATVYPFDSSNDGTSSNWTRYNGLRTDTYGYGDAVIETSTSGSDNTGWNSDLSIFPYLNFPFFIRGGAYTSNAVTGIFAFDNTAGYSAYYSGFRAVLVVQ